MKYRPRTCPYVAQYRANTCRYCPCTHSYWVSINFACVWMCALSTWLVFHVTLCVQLSGTATRLVCCWKHSMYFEEVQVCPPGSHIIPVVLQLPDGHVQCNKSRLAVSCIRHCEWEIGDIMIVSGTVNERSAISRLYPGLWMRDRRYHDCIRHCEWEIGDIMIESGTVNERPAISWLYPALWMPLGCWQR